MVESVVVRCGRRACMWDKVQNKKVGCSRKGEAGVGRQGSREWEIL